MTLLLLEALFMMILGRVMILETSSWSNRRAVSIVFISFDLKLVDGQHFSLQ